MNVLLVCSGGMSSAIVVKAIQGEAGKQGLDINVKSIGAGELRDQLKGNWDVLLVAPQVRHRLAEFQDAAAESGVPVALIPPQGYSPLGGATVIAEIRKIVK
ncbi:MAG: PTS sugar transporter subunit IIB [Negativicutes bacterium]|nr:PTS sugar transporter subunit IIB [Negativicutes bacterium]